MSTTFIYKQYEFDKISLTNLDSITINRDRRSNNELSTKKYIDDELTTKTILRFLQSLQNNRC